MILLKYTICIFLLMNLTFKLQSIQIKNRCHQEKLTKAFREITKRLTSEKLSNHLIINCSVPLKNARLPRNLMFLTHNNDSTFNLVNNQFLIRLKLKEKLIARTNLNIKKIRAKYD